MSRAQGGNVCLRLLEVKESFPCVFFFLTERKKERICRGAGGQGRVLVAGQ